MPKEAAMEELTRLLNSVEDSYYDFVAAMLKYASKKEERKNALLNFLKDNPSALSSDIIQFVSDRDDFFEDSALAKAI